MIRALACAMLAATACTPEPIFLGDGPADGGDAAVTHADATYPDATAPDAIIEDAGVPPDSGQEDSGQQDSGITHLDATTFGTGEYTLDFTVPVPEAVMCIDALGGHDAEFLGIVPADANLFPGPITITSTSIQSIFITGTPLMTAFGAGTMRLDIDLLPKQPEGTYVGGGPLTGPGPSGTHLLEGILAVDTLATQQNGLAGVVYENADMTGQCFITFYSTITPL